MEEWKAEGLITDANQLKGVDAAVGAAGTGDDFVVKAIYDACEIRVKTLLSQKTREDEVKTKRHGFEKGWMTHQSRSGLNSHRSLGLRPAKFRDRSLSGEDKKKRCSLLETPAIQSPDGGGLSSRVHSWV